MTPFIVIPAVCAVAVLYLLVWGLCEAASDERWDREEAEVIERERCEVRAHRARSLERVR